LILRKLKLQDVAKEDLKNQDIESMEQEMDANFALMQGEFGLVFDVLAKAFKVEEAS
jgi:DNA recombination-dependent growth factor C